MESTSSQSPTGQRADKQRRRLEVQVHPADIQRGVIYLFFTRRQLVAIGALVLLYVGVVAHGLWIAPSVIRSQLGHREYRAMMETRAKLGERLTALDGRLAELNGVAAELQLKMSKIYLAYGVPQEAPAGLGGYPVTPRDSPESIFSEQIIITARLEAGLREQTQVLGAFLGEIQMFEQEHEDQVLTTPSTSPLRGDSFVLTSPYGSRRNPFTKNYEFHNGVDLAAAQGTPVYATAAGQVTFAGRYSARQNVRWWRLGNLVAIRNGERFVCLFGHLDEIKVRSGQRVKQGDLLATVGSTGWSTNPHLHYEIRRLDDENSFRPADPRIYILDHRWRDEEQLLARARSAPDDHSFEALPRRIRR